MDPERKLISFPEMIILLIALLLIAFIVLKNNGGSVYERSETVQITDNPLSGGGKKQVRNYEMQNDERVEVILQKLSENFTYDNNAIPNDDINNDQTLSDEELNYFEEVKERHTQNEESKSPSDWLAILQASHKTYNKIKSVFEEADNTDKPVKEDNVSKMLKNELVANMVYSKIEELFNIPEEKARAFGETGKKAMSDWAEFVDQNQPKEK